MADSIAQRDIYGPSGMHYMSAYATNESNCRQTTGNDDGQTYEDFLHDEHLALQNLMLHPKAFHAEMMGNIMYPN